MKEAIKLMYSRKNKTPRRPEEFLGSFPRCIFAFVPQRVWVNGGGDVNGNFVDTRVEITKELLQH